MAQAYTYAFTDAKKDPWLLKGNVALVTLAAAAFF